MSRVLGSVIFTGVVVIAATVVLDVVLDDVLVVVVVDVVVVVVDVVLVVVVDVLVVVVVLFTVVVDVLALKLLVNSLQCFSPVISTTVSNSDLTSLKYSGGKRFSTSSGELTAARAESHVLW